MAELRDLSCVVEIEPSAASKGEAKALESIEKKLDDFSRPRPPPFIYKVHKQLRHVNEKAYEPDILAIGPYHRGKVDLQMMEEHKLRYLSNLIWRKLYVKVEDYTAAVARLEKEARGCYAEPTNHISSAEFIEMLVLDGCFIIEFLLKYCDNSTADDPIFETLWMGNCLKRDLMLFENQIPFFVLCKLFDMIYAPNQHDLLIDLVLYFFQPPGKYTSHDEEQINRPPPSDGKQINRLFRFCFKKLFPGPLERKETRSSSWENELHGDRSSEDIKHILDLLHSEWNCLSNPIGNDVNTHITRELPFINSATELGDANVEFQVLRKAKTMFDLDFTNGIISMPPLQIFDSTESVFRNLIAYEQYFPNDQPTSFTDYAQLLDFLINSSADVKRLSDCRIIENYIGDNKAMAKIFNQITHSVTMNDSFLYKNTFHLINTHYHRKKNRAIASLKRNYFNSRWAYISFSAALLLLSLTIAQTVLSALQLG